MGREVPNNLWIDSKNDTKKGSQKWGNRISKSRKTGIQTNNFKDLK